MQSRVSIAILLATLSLGAGAADQGFYAYASAGWTETSRKAEADSAIANLVATFTSSADEKDHGYKLQAGYRFNRHFALEGGYANFGKYTYDASSPLPATRHLSLKTDAWTLAAVGSLPVAENFALFGKLGAAAYHLKFRCDGTGVACVNPDRRENDSGVFYGIGADWNFGRQWFARAEYEVYEDVGSRSNATGTTGTSRADIKMGSIGVGFRF